MDIKSLVEKGHLYLDYPGSLRVAQQTAMDTWAAFAALPEQSKVLFGYTPDTLVSGNGYELKRTEANIDQKEDAHLRRKVREALLCEAAKAHPVIGPAFVEAGLKVDELIAPIIREFGESVERELDLVGFAHDVMQNQDDWLMRFLHYFGGRKVGEEFAAPHVDKGGYTLHLYESHGGVEYLDYQTKTWKPLPLSHGQTVIIPGMGLQHRSKCKIRALAHRVIALPETAEEGRWSSVCFLGCASRHWNKKEFGPTQGYAPGFFYDMPFGEFDKYFID